MRANLEENLARRPRLSSAMFNTVELVLSGAYTIYRDGPQFHYLNPNGVDRDLFLPPIEPGGGQFYIISNIGTAGSLVIRNSAGVIQQSVVAGNSSRVISSKTKWFVTLDTLGGISTINGQPGPTITIIEGEGIDVISPSANNIQVASQLFTSALRGSVPASGGGTVNFLRADGTWQAPPGGGGGGGNIASINGHTGPAVTIAAGINIAVNNATPNQVLIGVAAGGGAFFLFNDPVVGLLAKPITGDFLPAAQNAVLGAVKAKPVVAGQALIGLDETGTFVTGFTGREVLTASRAYFVRKDGSDSNTGLSDTAGGAFLTIQKAVDTACALDLSIFGVQINVRATASPPTSYAEPVTLRSYVGRGPISIVGNTALPQNIVIAPTSGDAFLASGVMGQYNVAGFTLQTAAGYACLRASGGPTFLQFQDIRWGNATFHAMADYGAQVFLTGTQTIIGDCFAHYQFTNKGIIQDVGKNASTTPITLVGTRNIGYWAFGNNNGFLVTTTTTYAGPTAVGQKFQNDTLALINTGTGNVAHFPCTNPGVTWIGGYF